MTSRTPPPTPATSKPGSIIHPSHPHRPKHSSHARSDYKVYSNPIAQPDDPPPEVVQKFLKPPPVRRSCFRTFVYWVQDHPWTATALLALILIGIGAAVLFSICYIQGCPALGMQGKNSQGSVQEDEPIGPPRLMLSFRNPTEVDALQLLPPLLRGFAQRLLLNSSGLQLLDFVDEDTLNAAKPYLQAHPNLTLLIRDYAMARLPGLELNSNSLLQDAITWTNSMSSSSNGSSSASGRRRGLQQSSSSTTSTTTVVPVNDPYFTNGTQWYVKAIKARQAWASSEGASDLIVAVIDTGADLTHPDLAGNLWVNKGEIPGNGIDDDGNGFVDDINGWDFAGGCKSNSSSTTCSSSCVGRNTIVDYSTHGTHVSGLVGAVQNNRLGITGIAPGVKLMIIRVADCKDGSIYSSAVAAAMDYAYRMGAHIVQCSFGMSYPNGFYPTQAAPWFHAGWIQTYKSAIQPLADKGVLVVAAAGNERIDLDYISSLGYAYNPCLVSLPNVLCVLSTDSQNNRMSDYSNYGAKGVHIGSPGRAIVSTMVGGSYGTMSGTSMSAPIVSGVAALVASILGGGDGNYFRATQIKDVLIQSGAVVTGLACSSGRMVDAKAAVDRAVAVASGALDLQAMVPEQLVSSQSGLSISGLTDSYFTVPSGTPTIAALNLGSASSTVSGTAASPLGVLPLIDSTPRAGGPVLAPPFRQAVTFNGSTGSAGLLLTSSGLMKIDRAGLHSLRVVTAASASSYQILLGGQPLKLTLLGYGAFTASQTGYLPFEIQMLNPRVKLEVLSRPPGATTFDTNEQNFVTSSMATYNPPAFVPKAELSYVWQVHYNTSLTDAQLPRNSYAAVNAMLGANLMPYINDSTTSTDTSTTLTAKLLDADIPPALTSTVVLSDLNFLSSGTLQAALLPRGAISGSSGARGVAGVATALWKAAVEPRNVVLKAYCKSCAVLVNGMVVLDAWPTAVAASSAPPPSPPPLAGSGSTGSASTSGVTSACISLAANTAQHIAVVFSGSDITTTPLYITWAPCGTSSSTDGSTTTTTTTTTSPPASSFSSLADRITNNLVWAPGDVTAGLVGGLQCDVWRGPDVPTVTESEPNPGSSSGTSWNSPIEAPPVYKVRMPGPTCSADEQQNEGFTTQCSTAWSFSLEDMLPGLAARFPNGVFSTRCWTYWAGGFVSGPVMTPEGVDTLLHVGGRLLWASSGGVTNAAGAAAAGATVVNELDGYFQLVAAEWRGIGPTDVMSVADGGDLLQVDLFTMMLPIPAEAQYSAFNPAFPSVHLGPQGHWSETSLPDVHDTQSLVSFDLRLASRVGVAQSSDYGLDGGFSYSNSLARQTRYTWAEGLLSSIPSDMETYTISLTDSALSATMLVMGDVTVRNARPFNPTGSLEYTTTTQIALPHGYFYTNVIVKTARPDGMTYFNIGITSVSTGQGGPIDNSIWYQAA